MESRRSARADLFLYGNFGKNYNIRPTRSNISIFTSDRLNMCKYCEPFDGDINSIFDRQSIDLLEGRGLGTEMFLVEEPDNPGEFRLKICNNRTGETLSSVKLDYCPFCRRKLNATAEDTGEVNLVSREWNSVSAFEAQPPAWQSVPAYSGFTGSTPSDRWGYEGDMEAASAHRWEYERTRW